MFTQKQLQELYDSNCFIVQRVSDYDSLIVHTPSRQGGENTERYFSVDTSTYDTYTEFINSIMGTMHTKANIEYIDEEDYKNKLYDKTLI